MGKPSRDKGARRERQLVELHRSIGVRAERVPLSGASKFRNTEKTDCDIYIRGKDEAPWVTECKARASGEGFVTLERWLGEADALFLMRDRSLPLVVLPWERWQEVISLLRLRGVV
jgi:Holliday junction resolvase